MDASAGSIFLLDPGDRLVVLREDALRDRPGARFGEITGVNDGRLAQRPNPSVKATRMDRYAMYMDLSGQCRGLR